MKKNLFFTTILALSVLSLSSCLKDSSYVDFSASQPIVEFPLVAFSGQLQPAALPILTTPQNIPVAITIASPNPLGTDTKVTVKVDQAAFNTYNAANGNSYTLLPTADYTIPSLTVTIPAGQRTGYLNISVNSSLIDLTQAYILPLTISDASGLNISGNYRTAFYNVQAKNKYDGVYKMRGYILRAGDPVLTGYFSGSSQTLATAGANTVTGLTQIWSGGSGVAGVSPISLTVDPSTNNVTVSSSVNATLIQDSTYPNRYDPATKTFYVSFYWNAGKTSRDATDTLVYQGPRP